LLSPEKNLRNDGSVILGKVIDAPDMVLGKNENVNGCLGVLVFESHHRIVLIYEVSRFLTLYNLAKNAIFLSIFHMWLIPFFSPTGLNQIEIS
jgi:hypothetical protein